MTQVALDYPQIDAGLQQMSSIRMAQGVNGRFFLDTAVGQERTTGDDGESATAGAIGSMWPLRGAHSGLWLLCLVEHK